MLRLNLQISPVCPGACRAPEPALRGQDAEAVSVDTFRLEAGGKEAVPCLLQLRAAAHALPSSQPAEQHLQVSP